MPNSIRLSEGIGLIAVTGLVNFALSLYHVKNGQSLKSLTIEAGGKHLQIVHIVCLISLPACCLSSGVIRAG